MEEKIRTKLEELRGFLQADGGDLEIGFNDHYLSDALKAAPADELNVCLNTGSSPCIFVPADGSDNFVYMVLPVRLRAGQ